MKTLFQRLVPGGIIVIFERNPFNPVTRKIVNTCPYDRTPYSCGLRNLRHCWLVPDYKYFAARTACSCLRRYLCFCQ